MPEPREGEEYVTATQALALLQVSKSKLAAMIKSGELPTYPNPRHKQVKLIKKADIDAWLSRAPQLPSRRAPTALPTQKGEMPRGINRAA
jgi:excisionase family DNA binding protein